MGCYLGSSVFNGSIVCNGHMNVECTEFPADQGDYTVYLLVTTSGTGTIGGGPVYLEYNNGTAWVQINNYTMSGQIGPGWAEVHFTVTPNGWTGQMRLRDDTDGCVKEWTQYKSTHKGCDGNGACVELPGRGPNLCMFDNPDCQYRKCVNGSCAIVVGTGVNQCDELGETVCYHTECQDRSCVTVNSPGSMNCYLGGTQCYGWKCTDRDTNKCSQGPDATYTYDTEALCKAAADCQPTKPTYYRCDSAIKKCIEDSTITSNQDNCTSAGVTCGGTVNGTGICNDPLKIGCTSGIPNTYIVAGVLFSIILLRNK